MTPTSAEGAERQSPLTPKQRRFLHREAQILEAARSLLLKEGVRGLTMERIAEAIDYGRGIVYEHFASKEDIILGLGVEATRLRKMLSERVLEFDARPRERMVALAEISDILFPRHFLGELLSITNVTRDRVSEERAEEGARLEARTYGVGIEVVQQGVDAGDLVLPDRMTPADMSIGLWFNTLGGYAMRLSDTPLERFGVTQPVHVMKLLGGATMDGLGWRPLSTEWDYAETLRRIYEEVFPPEMVSEIGASPGDSWGANI